MSPNVPGQDGAFRKDSIFSAIAPAPAPLPAAAPSALRPAADAEAMAALKQKIDMLEKNIVSQLERKMGEQFKSAVPHPPQPPSPPPPAAAQLGEMLYRRIDELERRLADFGHAASISASQFKNIEESKIGARREIEDLLKAVREQQKYSEMDRQMHEQLEKSWARAGELEKKLMDFYSSVLAMEAKRREETASSSDRAAGAIEALSARLAGLEEKISALAEGPEHWGEQEAVSRELISLLKENAGSFKDTFDVYIHRELELLRDKFSQEAETQRRGIADLADNFRILLKEQLAVTSGTTMEFERMLQKAGGVEAAVEASLRRHEVSLADFAGRIKADLRGANSEFTTAVKKENEELLAKFGARYADALLSLTFVESFRSALGNAINKLAEYEGPFKGFLKEIPPEALERVMGVSGHLLREKVEAMTATIGSLKSDEEKLREIKRGVEERVRDIFGNR